MAEASPALARLNGESEQGIDVRTSDKMFIRAPTGRYLPRFDISNLVVTWRKLASNNGTAAPSLCPGTLPGSFTTTMS